MGSDATSQSSDPQDDPRRLLNEPFDEMFSAEIKDWVSRLPKYGDNPAIYNPDHPDPRNNLVGLAMSGGGMRSATYNLGVAQALAEYGLMEQVDYISAVSGGGYAGSSLTSLCAEELPYTVPGAGPGHQPDNQKRGPARLGMKKDNFPYAFPNPLGAPPVRCDGRSRVIVHGLESPATRHVREHANLIVRSAGLFDTETWFGVSRYTVSVVLLWGLFLLPQITAVFLLTMLIPDSIWSRSSPFTEGWLSRNLWLMALPGMLAGAAAFLSLIPVGDYHQGDDMQRGVSWLVHRVAIRVVLIAMGLTGAAVLFVIGLWLHTLVVTHSNEWLQRGFTVVLAGGATSALGSMRMLPNLPRSAKKTLFTVLFGVSGYYVLGLGMVAWYFFLWHGWSFIGWDGFPTLGPDYYLAWAILLVLIAFTWAAGHHILNYLSLNPFYERRIQRTWLIAATPGKGRKSDDSHGETRKSAAAWTHVWVRPDIKVGTLMPENQEARKQWKPTSPYPMICTALNIPGSTGPKLLDRKSDCFVIAPVYTGSALTRWKPTGSLSTFRSMALAKAAAISGAAVSPNMGVRTNTTLSILTALFNVRLGWWVRNPRSSAWWRRWIMTAPALYWKELFGMATHTDALVYLSDGGHFENLGIYELLRRRCKYIIAIDGTGEPASDKEKLAFGGIGIPLRQARIDFGVLVDLDLRPVMRHPETGLVQSHFAVGRIRYPRGDGHGSGRPEDPDSGTLVLIKAARVDGMTPPDIVHYSRAINSAFPHDPTADQQFDEPQFESYRELGFLAGRAVCKSATGNTVAARFGSLDRYYQGLLVDSGLSEPEPAAPTGPGPQPLAATAGLTDDNKPDA